MTRLLSNILKRGSAVYQEERIIDYNQILKEKIKSFTELSEKNKKRMGADGFVSGLDVPVLEIDDDNFEGLSAEELLQAATVEKETEEDILNNARKEAAEIIDDANKKAKDIVKQAKEEAQAVLREAQESGYKDGVISAQNEYQNMSMQLENDYANKSQQLESEYQKLRDELEPDLVNTLVDVFAKVTHTIAEDNKEVVLHLINNVVKNVENSHEFTIRVSPEDYEFVINNQGKIYCSMSNEVNLEVIQDTSLKSSECIVETDTGVFNCSLDIELNNLIKEIKLLSCI